MTLVITENRVKDRAPYLKLAMAFAEDAKSDKGCFGMEVYINPQKEDSVIFASKWNSKEDFEVHVSGEAFAKHIPGMAVHYVSGTDTFLELVE